MKCRILVSGTTCPLCKGTNLVDTWKGRVYIADPNKSEIAKKIEVTVKGEYVIKLK